ncbi:MAG: glycosyltransferase family 2 protein [Clostridia bacterium]|nr:glycosyltransferase family 2 protein [Clostridia bacterium]
MPEVSVIVPVYNAEKYLKRCLDSLLNQTFTDFEVIMVDDGSTDRSFNICSYYAREDLRFHAVRVPSGGVSSARNTGIGYSHGKYLAFCDSDDYVEPDWMERMYALSVGNEGMTICGYRVVDERTSDGSEGRYVVPRFTYCQKSDFFDICIQTLFYTVWNKMYSARLIKSHRIEFEKGLSVGEDLLFNLAYLNVSDNAIYLDGMMGYNYVLRKSDSLDNKYYKDLYDIYVRLYSELYRAILAFEVDIEKYGGKYYEIYLRMLVAALMNNMSDKNDAPFFKKLSHNSALMKREEFVRCVENADRTGYSPLYFRILKTGSFPLLLIYKKLCPYKMKIKKLIGR